MNPEHVTDKPRDPTAADVARAAIQRNEERAAGAAAMAQRCEQMAAQYRAQAKHYANVANQWRAELARMGETQKGAA